MSRTERQQTDVDCTVRPYQPGDDDEFLSLYETVWGSSKGRSWFDWRFAENPHSDGVEMIVATRGGRVVGAEPLVPYRLRHGERVVDAYQPVDWIVHPDHRREGVFTAMTEHLLDRVAERAALLFNFPNEQLLPGIQRLGWQAVGTVAARYRIQDAGAAATIGASGASRFSPVALAGASSPLVRGGLGVLDRIGSTDDGVTVDRDAGVSVKPVQECYEAAVPERLHVPRDPAFLEWRFGNPHWETTTYVARRGGDALSTAIAAVESVNDTRLGRLLDVQPRPTLDRDPAAFESILRAFVADHADAGLLRAPTECYPAVCRRYGFLRDDVFPLSRISSTTHHAVRPLADGLCDGRLDPTVADSWCLAPCDLDVA